MTCPQCNSQITGPEGFCVNCGTSLQPLGVVSAGGGIAVVAAPVQEAAVQPEALGKRVVSYVIDCLPAVAFIFLSAIPFIGILFAVLHCAYWLLRDITGSSLGKMITGSVVVSSDGSPASGAQKVGRNVFLALPGLFGLIPLFGWLVELPLMGAIILLEVGFLLATGRRFGDRIAGTTVISKNTTTRLLPA